MSGLLDTSVIIDWEDPAVRAALPAEVTISAVTVAELAAGPALATVAVEAARRQTRLQKVEATFEPLAFDAAAARSYGLVVAATVGRGRHPRRLPGLLTPDVRHGVIPRPPSAMIASQPGARLEHLSNALYPTAGVSAQTIMGH